MTRRHVQREAAFQAIVDRFLDRVVVPPFWCTGINHENELTDNARSRARARGIKPGVHDIYVCQHPGRSIWMELKWGSNKPSEAQVSVSQSLGSCLIPSAFCWSIYDVLRALRIAGFKLHGNADNLATEYQEKARAAVLTAELKASGPRSYSGPPRVRVSPARIARAERARRLP